MNKKFLIVSLSIFSLQCAIAQTTGGGNGGFSSIIEGKQKIEKTVPLVINYIKEVSTKQGDNTILNNTQTALNREYQNVASELELYKYNMTNCAMLSSKKASSCMNYHTSYLKNTLEKYNNFVTNISKKNAFYNMSNDQVNIELNPTEIANKMNTDFAKSTGAIKKMKKSGKKAYYESLKNDDYKLSKFENLLN